MRRSVFLSNRTSVPVWDLRPWFMGPKRKESLDAHSMMNQTSPRTDLDLPGDSIVGILHSISFYDRNSSSSVDTIPALSLNVLGAVLLVSRPVKH